MQAVVAALRELPAAIAVSEAGSVRRRKETFRDLDIIASATSPPELTEHFTQLPWVVDTVAHGDTKATVLSRDGFRLDLRVVPHESFGNLLQHFTGSKDHNVALREEAVRRGLSISEYGVTTVESGEVFRAVDEAAVYEFLGYQPIPPELRENGGELEAARRGELPKLVELRDVRGDLHTHSHWSADGKSSLEEMLEAAAGRGYEYYAVTDHSHYLRGGRLQEQLEEIERLRARFPGSGSSPAWRRTSARAARWTCRRRISRCSTGSSPPSTRRPTRGRRSACSRRWQTRTSTASAISPAGGSAGGRRGTSTSSA